MGNKPSLNFKKVEKLLLQHGFVLDRIKGSHHIYIHPENHRRVSVPRHKKDIPFGTLYSILKEANIPFPSSEK